MNVGHKGGKLLKLSSTSSAKTILLESGKNLSLFSTVGTVNIRCAVILCIYSSQYEITQLTIDITPTGQKTSAELCCSSKLKLFNMYCYEVGKRKRDMKYDCTSELNSYRDALYCFLIHLKITHISLRYTSTPSLCISKAMYPIAIFTNIYIYIIYQVHITCLVPDCHSGRWRETQDTLSHVCYDNKLIFFKQSQAISSHDCGDRARCF